ncbi:MAG: class I SAM-dependent methyltransferase [Thermoplasmata archaeon]|nr:class I SAM-dependent methyltransferase [Thermoplasmata archaeon]
MSPRSNRPRRASKKPGKAFRALGDLRAVPQVRWLTQLTGASRSEVEETLAEVDDLVEVEREIREAHLSAGRPGYAQIRAPFELYALVRLRRPDHVVEAGVSSGVSSAHFLLALARNRHGRLHSVDWPTFQRGPMLGPEESPVSVPPCRSSGWAIPDRLKAGWDLRIGRSQELLPMLVDELPSVDVFLHDDLHTPAHLTFELTTIQPKLTPGAVVLADNTIWTGASFPRFAKRLGVPWFPRGRTDLVGLRAPDRAPAVTPRRARARP